MTMQRRWGGLLLLGVVLLGAGCGSGSGRVAVDGTITYQGNLLKEGSIQFEPMNNPQAYSAGSVIKDGKYSIAADKGLLPGKYSIKISGTIPTGKNPGEAGGMLVAKELLPARYNTRTALTKDVTAANPNRLDFTLD